MHKVAGLIDIILGFIHKKHQRIGNQKTIKEIIEEVSPES